MTDGSPIEKRLGDALRTARQAIDLTQEQLAERAQISPSTVQRFEAALVSPTIGMLSRLAHSLQLDIATLWEGIDGPRNPRLDLDNLTECERDFVTALARFLADRRRQDNPATQ